MLSVNPSAREWWMINESYKGAIGEIDVNRGFCLEIEEEMRLPDFNSIH